MTNELQVKENVAMDLIDGVDVGNLNKQLQKINQFQALIQRSLTATVDYGVIPGTSKPTLLKPGAEKICLLMGLCSEFEIIDSERNFTEGFFQYQVKCTLTKNGIDITSGLGSCNSKERKYQKLQACDIENTILKMAKKRSLIDATLMVASLSNIFTQDLEDIKIPEEQQVERQYTDQDGVISMAQAKRLFAIAKGNNEIIKYVLKEHGYSASKDIKKTEYNTIVAEVEQALAKEDEAIERGMDE